MADLSNRLAELENATPKIDKQSEQAVRKLEEAIRTQFPEGVTQALEGVIAQRMPSFLYFSEYSQLQGKVDLEHLFDDSSQLDPSQLTARSLLRLANADNRSLLALDYEERRSELEGKIWDHAAERPEWFVTMPTDPKAWEPEPEPESESPPAVPTNEPDDLDIRFDRSLFELLDDRADDR